MSLRTTIRGASLVGQLYSTLASWYWSPTLRFALFRGLAIGLVGVVLGAVVLISASDTILTMAVLLGLGLSPFLLVIATCLVGNLKRLLIAVIIMEIPLGIDYNYGFSEIVSESNALSGINISVTTLCLIILYLWWIAELGSGETDRLPTRYLLANRPLVAYVLAVALSIMVATSVYQSIVELNLLLQSVLLYVYLVYATRTRRDVFIIAVCLVLGLVLQSLIMIALHFIGATIDLGVITLTVWKNSRIGGTLAQPNSAGAYLALALVMALSVTATPVRWHFKWLAVLAFTLGIVALLLTLSRGAWISFTIAVVLFWLLAWRRGWLNLVVPLIVILCAIPVAIYFREMLIERLFGDDGATAESRLPLMLLALRMIHDHWLFGVGANNFANQLRNYVTPEMAMDWITTVHNKYLLVWAETGIAGIVFFVWFLLAALRRGWQAWKTEDRFLAPIALGFTLALLGWIVHMNFDLFHGRPQVQLLLVMSALITALHNMAMDTTHG